MGTIAEKLAKALASKEDIKAAITEKGQTPGDVLADYPAKIRAIQTSVDTSDATATSNDIAQGKIAYAKGEKITGSVDVRDSNRGVGFDMNNVFTVGDDMFFSSNIGANSVSLLLRPGAQVTIGFPKSLLGNATPSDVALGKMFTSESGINMTGTGSLVKAKTLTIKNTKVSDVVSLYGGTIAIDQLGSNSTYEFQQYTLITFVTNYDSHRTFSTQSGVTLVRKISARNEGYEIWVFRINENATMTIN